MKRNTKYVGLDVHQATTVASVREAGGRVIARSVLETDGHAIREFFGGMRGTIHVAFEEGTQAQWLYDLLAPQVDRVLVCDRRGEKRTGNKADRVDADGISEQLRCGTLRSVYHGNRHQADLKEFTRAYRSLVEDGTRVMLRLKALFRARAVRAPGTNVYRPSNRRQWIDRLPERGARLRAETLYAELDQNFDAFRGHVLVSMHEFGGDWPTWEKHPAGDEIVMLWSGRGTLVLRSGTGEETVALGEPGAYVVVPRGTWHTARIAEPTRMLFITPGEGHRESRAARLSAS